MNSPLSASITALAIDGAQPTPGDEVEVTVRARVGSIENGRAILEPIAVNGEDLAASQSARPGEQPLSEDEIRAMAIEADGEDDDEHRL